MYETETSDSKRTRAVGVEQQQINLGYECIPFQTSSSSTTTLAYQKRLISTPCWQKAKLNQNKGLILNKTQKKKTPNWRIGQAIKAQLRLLRRANKRNLVGLKSWGMWGMWCIRLGEEHRPPIALRATAPRWAPACWLPSFCFRAASSGGGWSATNCGGTAATDFERLQNCGLCQARAKLENTRGKCFKLFGDTGWRVTTDLLLTMTAEVFNTKLTIKNTPVLNAFISLHFISGFWRPSQICIARFSASCRKCRLSGASTCLKGGQKQKVQLRARGLGATAAPGGGAGIVACTGRCHGTERWNLHDGRPLNGPMNNV